jgi:hypothetical protein
MVPTDDGAYGSAEFSGRGHADDRYAGELFLALAAEGRLVLDPALADPVIAHLEATVREVDDRVERLDRWRRRPEPVTAAPARVIDQRVTDVVFADQIAPGQLEQAQRELPKYLAAFKIARRPSPTIEP